MKTLLTGIFFLFCLYLHAQKNTKVVINQKGFENKHELTVALNFKVLEGVKDGEIIFEETMKIEKPMYGMIIKNNGQYAGFWIEPGKGEVTITKDNFSESIQVKGSKSHEAYLRVRYAKDKNSFKHNFLKHKNNEGALYVLNKEFQSKSFDTEELKTLFNSTDRKNLLPQLEAYLNTVDITKMKVGEQIFDFTANDQNGHSFSTEDYRGKYLLLEFSATACAPCWHGYPDMIEESKKYKELRVLTYNEDNSIETWNKIARERNISLDWPVLWDGENKADVFEVFNIKGTPYYFLISPEGKVLDSWFGSKIEHLGKALKANMK